MQNHFCENEFFLSENKKNCFHSNGVAIGFALKQRLEATGKWLKIGGLPNFNMFFHLVLTKCFKSELFSCLPKLIT